MHHSDLLRQMKRSTPEEKERQRLALEKVLREREQEMARKAPIHKVVTNTNLTREDVANCNWNILEINETNRLALDKVKKWTPEKQAGLFLWGGVGTGKTHILKGLMINWAQRQGTSGLFFSLQDLMNNFREHLDDLQHYKRQLMNCEILIIDDFGAEKTTEFVQVEFLSFVDKRIAMGKSLFMSSNYSPDKLKKIYDIRILDRLQALMVFIKCDGGSYRRIIARRNNEQFD